MINKTLLVIDGFVVPKITNFQIGRNKLWKDAERNMNGDVRATLIGVFPKLSCEVSYLNQNEMQALTKRLDKAYFSVTFYDSRTDETTTAQYYASDYTTELFNKRKGIYKPLTISLIPISKVGY